MHLSRLPRTGDDEGSAAVGFQIPQHRCPPFIGFAHPHDGPGAVEDFAGLHPVTVISHRAGDRKGRLRYVEPVHPVGALIHFAAS